MILVNYFHAYNYTRDINNFYDQESRAHITVTCTYYSHVHISQSRADLRSRRFDVEVCIVLPFPFRVRHRPQTSTSNQCFLNFPVKKSWVFNQDTIPRTRNSHSTTRFYQTFLLLCWNLCIFYLVADNFWKYFTLITFDVRFTVKVCSPKRSPKTAF